MITILVDLELENFPDQECGYYIDSAIKTRLVSDFSTYYDDRNYKICSNRM
jgi:hypothetical protein